MRPISGLVAALLMVLSTLSFVSARHPFRSKRAPIYDPVKLLLVDDPAITGNLTPAATGTETAPASETTSGPQLVYDPDKCLGMSPLKKNQSQHEPDGDDV
jgi:hypothetical protein